MSKIKKTIREKIADGLLFGACATTIIGSGVVAGYGIKELINSNNQPKETEDETDLTLRDLPLNQNRFGEVLYNKTQNWNIVLTNQFEQEFFKDTTKIEQDFAVNALKQAVSDFNALTSYFNYSLTAETDGFSSYGIEKNTDTYNLIYFTIEDLQDVDEAGATILATRLGGEIVSAKISYVKDIIFGNFDEHTKNVYALSNSVFTTVIEHELLHTLGFEDIYFFDSKKPTIMFYKLNDKVRTYTKLDKKNVSKYESIIIKNNSLKNGNEIEKE